MQEFFKRINYQGSIKDIASAVCRDFRLGDYVSSKLVAIGYEDFNFFLESSKGKFFVKVFSTFRSDADCVRYVKVVSEVLKIGVKTPRLFKFGSKYLYFKKINGIKLRLCLMEYVDGESYYSLKEKPGPDELKYLAKQASLINSSGLKPRFIYDSWAVTSFGKEFQKKGKYLEGRDLGLIKPLYEKFKKTKLGELPHCLVHGDLLSTNVMRDKNGDIWIIDFSVANYAPRIQELAVLACDLPIVDGDEIKTENNLRIILKEYKKKIKLTEKELKTLPFYIKLAHAMDLLLSTYHKEAENNNSEENKHWINHGRKGLIQMLNI